MALFLTMKPDSEVRIGEVRVYIMSIQGGRVTLGVDAPRDIPITRHSGAFGEIVPNASPDSENYPDCQRR